MADSSATHGLLPKAIESALKAHDEGYRIIADWFNDAFEAWKIDAHIEADPPPPGVSLDDCQRQLSNALLGIRPLCPNLPLDDKLCPWAVGYLRTSDDRPGNRLGGIGLCEDRFSPWNSADTVLETVGTKHAWGWKDAGQWRVHVIDPMEQHARSWRKWLRGFQHGEPVEVGKSVDPEPIAEVGKSVDPEPIAETGSGSVRLFGRNKNPIVHGKEKPSLTNAQYDVVLALLKAGEKGLTKDGMDRKSEHGDSRKILQRLANSDSDWESVIPLPGSTGKGYRII